MELEAYETRSVKVLHVADDTESLMIERGSFYAAWGRSSHFQVFLALLKKTQIIKTLL